MSCPACFSGTLRSDEKPTGTITKLHGLPTYVARPEGTPRGIVVIVSDAFGWATPNVRVLADRYASGGHLLVYVPDFMQGTACSDIAMSLMEAVMAPASWFDTLVYKPLYMLRAAYHFVPWVVYNRPPLRKALVFDFFRALRSSPDTVGMKIGAAGFCWGGKFVAWLCADTPSSRVHLAESTVDSRLHSLIDCGFTAHPSLWSVPDDVDAISIPISVAIGPDDMALKTELAEQAKTILEKKKEGEHEFVMIPGAKHGFAVRGALSDPKQKELGELAEKQALAWFARFLT